MICLPITSLTFILTASGHTQPFDICNMLLSKNVLGHISSHPELHAAYGHRFGYPPLSLIYSNVLPLFIGVDVPYFIFSVEWNDSLGIVRITDCDMKVLIC